MNRDVGGRLRRWGAVAGWVLCGGTVAWAQAPGGVRGAGSSAAAPVYRVWADEYVRAGGPVLAYEPVGSSAGMARIRAGQVDFGASDVMAAPDALRRDGLVMFPTVITGVVPVVNLPRVAVELRLTGELLARIFLGEVSRWDAAEIRALNPGLALPAEPIRRVVRADGSGTTHHFSSYLAQVHAGWRQAPGVGSTLAWPGEVLAVKGSAEVSRTVRATPWTIGYIDHNYVEQDGLTGVALRNADGHFVRAEVEGFRAAVARSAWFTHGDFSVPLVDIGGAKTWPITMGTYVALPLRPADAAAAERALRFLAWGFLHGDTLARQARFVPLPAKVQASAWREMSRISSTGGQALGARVMGELMAAPRR